MNGNRGEKLKAVYKNAEVFLYDIAPKEVYGDELEKYFDAPDTEKTKPDILYELLFSLQNRHMLARVIGLRTEDRVPIFKKILLDYDTNAILKEYTEDSLYRCFEDHFNIRNSSNSWFAYAKAVLSACNFLNKFNSAEDFHEFVMLFTYNELSLAALPMLLEKEIFGMGFALACDFLMNLGYDGYPKPDVHIKGILFELGLCENDDYAAYKTVLEMAKAVGETPYKVDKILWLIGSGNFYIHKVSIGRNKDKFIEKMK